jgi:hypothetical protein
MKSPDNKSSNKTLKTKVENKISNAIKSELPKLHLKMLKKFKGKHSLVNSFIYIPDIVNGGDFDVIKFLNKNTYDVRQYMTTGSIKYDLIGFSFNKLMQLKFEYLVEDEESGLCTTVWLIEKSEDWKVTKIEPYWEI